MAGGSRRSVLITRPEPGASETAERVLALGLEPVVAPLLQVKSLASCLAVTRPVQAVLATSGNAIAGIAGIDPSRPLLAVGDATAERARTAGFTAVESADGDATTLAALACRRLEPAAGPLLLVCGRGHGLPLATSLRRAGFRVLRRAVYAAEPVRALPPAAVAALQADRLRAALFFSAETARQFVSLTSEAGLMDAVRGAAALAISAPAGVALSLLPWGDLLIAARPNQDELLALLP
jgi:uroporphyrinogen-III synthase